LETTGTTGAPGALDQALRAHGESLVQPSADGVTSLPTPSRASRRPAWPEVRFYLGAVALFFISFALATGMWVVGPMVVLGWEPVAITSGSMAPAIRQGDVVVFSDAPVEPVGPGTVIVYADRNGSLVTHRVAATLDDGRYITHAHLGSGAWAVREEVV